jgi:hypothetical protein
MFKMLKITIPFLFMIVLATHGSAQQSGSLDLSGTWSFTTKYYGDWKVEVKNDSRATKKGDPIFCGRGVRKEKTSEGRDFTATICVFKDKDEFNVQFSEEDSPSPKLPFLVCTAPFKTQGTMEGRCLDNYLAEGAFTAARGPGK